MGRLPGIGQGPFTLFKATRPAVLFSFVCVAGSSRKPTFYIPRPLWDDAACDTASYILYDVADLCGVEVVQAESYFLIRTRRSYLVRLDCEEAAKALTYVGRIIKHVKVIPGENAEAEGAVLRLAVTDIFLAQDKGTVPTWRSDQTSRLRRPVVV